MPAQQQAGLPSWFHPGLQPTAREPPHWEGLPALLSLGILDSSPPERLPTDALTIMSGPQGVVNLIHKIAHPHIHAKLGEGGGSGDFRSFLSELLPPLQFLTF